MMDGGSFKKMSQTSATLRRDAISLKLSEYKNLQGINQEVQQNLRTTDSLNQTASEMTKKDFQSELKGCCPKKV